MLQINHEEARLVEVIGAFPINFDVARLLLANRVFTDFLFVTFLLRVFRRANSR